MRTNYVYLLASRKNGTFYVGWTTDMQRRLDEHNARQSRYTKSRGSWQLVGYEVYATSEEAKQRERTLKRNPNMFFLFKKRLLTASRPAVGGPSQVVG